MINNLISMKDFKRREVDVKNSCFLFFSSIKTKSEKLQEEERIHYNENGEMKSYNKAKLRYKLIIDYMNIHINNIKP